MIELEHAYEPRRSPKLRPTLESMTLLDSRPNNRIDLRVSSLSQSRAPLWRGQMLRS